MPQVRMPDGTVVAFPDDMPAEQIKGLIATKFPQVARKVDPATNQPQGVPEYVPPGVQGYDPKTGEVARQYSMPGSAAMGAADAATAGFGDEVASYLGSALTGVPRDQVLSEMRGDARQAAAQNPGSYLGGQLAAGVAQGAGIAGGGMSLAANAARAGQGLGRVAFGGAADGLVLGGLHGAGGGTDMQSRAKGAVIGGGLGLGLGVAAPYAIAGAQAAARPVITPLMARLRPGVYAERAMAEGLKRAGQSPDDVASILTRAGADNQGMFNVADAMGHSGQRMLSTVARNPNNMRQTVVDALTDRQMGQGERLSNFLAEGFGATDTATQRAASLSSKRAADATVNYGVASNGASPVNLTGAIDKIDALLHRDPILGESALSSGPIGSRLKGLRDQLQKGGEQLVDFNRVVGIKSDLFNAMKRNPDVAQEMRPVYNELDKALESASSGYRNANDSYRTASKVIEAVDTGRAAASGRSRAPDNIANFQRMTPDEQSAFRAGYVDPLIARTEGMAVSPSTNKARSLMTTKSGQEFPEFAAPGQADRMGNRIAREQRMFETANTALGGSKTADNLADAAEMSKFDPGVMMNLLRGRPIQAAVDAVAKLANEAKGMPPSVMERIARNLLETRPDVARAMLSGATARQSVYNGRRALANAILINMGSVGAGRLASP